MLDGFQRLIDLQRLDHELKGYEAERSGLPARRERMASEREAVEQRVAGASAAVEEAEVRQRRAETELQDSEALLQKLEGQQHQVKTNEAYTALLHEMEQARSGISACETRILEAMEAIEGASEELAAAERASRQAVAHLEDEARALDAREKELEAEISRLREQRDGAAGEIENRLLAQYEKIAARRWPAVVIVDSELCSGCRVDIPPQTFIELLRGENLITCGHCHRILLASEQGRAARDG